MNIFKQCNAQVKIAIIFASLMLAISMITKGSENNLMITFLLMAGYFSCAEVAKKSAKEETNNDSDN